MPDTPPMYDADAIKAIQQAALPGLPVDTKSAQRNEAVVSPDPSGKLPPPSLQSGSGTLYDPSAIAAIQKAQPPTFSVPSDTSTTRRNEAVVSPDPSGKLPPPSLQSGPGPFYDPSAISAIQQAQPPTFPVPYDTMTTRRNQAIVSPDLSVPPLSSVRLLPVDSSNAAVVAKRNEAATQTTIDTAGIDPDDSATAQRTYALSQKTPAITATSTGIAPTNGTTQQNLLRQSTISSRGSGLGTQAADGSEMILSARGTFYLVKLASTYGPGIYGISELNELTYLDNKHTVAERLASPLVGGSRSPILITGIEFNQVDITSQVPCLDNIKVFYTFGQNFGQVVITGEILMGPLGDISYDGVDRLVTFFWQNRVSVKKSPIAVSVGDKPYFVYLTGLRIGTINPEFHVMPFVMFGTLLDLAKEKAYEINTAGIVITGANVDDPSLFEALQAEMMGDSILGNIEEPEAAKKADTVSPADKPGASQAGTAGPAGKDIENKTAGKKARSDSKVDRLQRYKAVLVHDQKVLATTPSNFNEEILGGTAETQLDNDIKEIDKAISYARQVDQRKDELEARQKEPTATARDKKIAASRMKDVEDDVARNDPAIKAAYDKYLNESGNAVVSGELTKVKVQDGQYDYPVVTKDPDAVRSQHGAFYNYFMHDIPDYWSGKGVQAPTVP